MLVENIELQENFVFNFDWEILLKIAAGERERERESAMENNLIFYDFQDFHGDSFHGWSGRVPVYLTQPHCEDNSTIIGALINNPSPCEDQTNNYYTSLHQRLLPFYRKLARNDNFDIKRF